MIISVPTCKLAMRSSPPVVEVNVRHAVFQIFAEIKETVSIVTDYKVRGPPGYVNLSYKESALRCVLLVA